MMDAQVYGEYNQVPPPSLIEEVRLVQYDHHRRKHLNAFRNAFKAGQVTGFVLRLNLVDISYGKLNARLALIREEGGSTGAKLVQVLSSNTNSDSNGEEREEREEREESKWVADEDVGNTGDPLEIMTKVRIRRRALFDD